MAPGSTACSDGLACLGAVTQAGCTHQPTVVVGRKPRNLPEFRWVNTVLGNLESTLSGSDHAFDFRTYAARYLAAFAYRFNHRFDLSTRPARRRVAAAHCGPHSQRSIRVAETHC